MTQPAFKRPPMPSGAFRASLASCTKDIRRHRTSPRQGKETARGPVPVSHSSGIGPAGARCLYCVASIVVFIDETSVETDPTRPHGRSPRGVRLAMDAAFGSLGKQILIAGLIADATIASWAFEGAMGGPALPPVSKRFLFLPPYSADPNPMEMAFSKLKAHLCRIGARTFTDMFDALAEIRQLCSPQKSWNDFKATGHVSS